MQHILRTTVDNTFKLAINTHLDEKSYAKTRMLDFSNATGFIIDLKTKKITNWEIEGCTVVAQEKNLVFLYGPDFEGISLIDFLKKNSISDSYILIKKLINIYSENKDLSLPGPEGMFISPKNEEILILPDELWLRCLSQDSEKTYSNLYGSWIHPILKGEPAILHYFGTLLYFLFSNKISAYQNDTTEGIYQDIIDKNVIPLRFQSPLLNQNISLFIDSLITQKKSTVSLNDLAKMLPSNIEDCFSEKEMTNAFFEKNKNKFLNRQKKQINRNRFFRRNENRFKIGVGIALILLIFGIFIANEQFSRPSTSDMTAEEVVKKFYYSFSEMDQTWMRACSINHAGDYYEQTVLNVSVNNAMRQTLERQKVIFTPGEWANLENPSEKQVFGITKLSIREEEKKNPLKTKFFVHFYLLVPQIAESYGDTLMNDIEYTMSLYPLIGFEIEDEVELEKTNGKWRINLILNQKNKSIPVDSTYYFENYKQGLENSTVLWGPSQDEISIGKQKLEKEGYLVSN